MELQTWRHRNKISVITKGTDEFIKLKTSMRISLHSVPNYQPKCPKLQIIAPIAFSPAKHYYSQSSAQAGQSWL